MSAPERPAEARAEVIHCCLPKGGFQTAQGFLSGSLTSAEGYVMKVGKVCLEVRKPADPVWAGRAVFLPLALVSFTTQDP